MNAQNDRPAIERLRAGLEHRLSAIETHTEEIAELQSKIDKLRTVISTCRDEAADFKAALETLQPA